MNAPFRKLTLVSAIALAMASLSAPAFADPACPDLDSARQETQILTTYSLSPYLRSNDIQVSVKNGKATLTGSVDREIGKELANEIAIGVDGVTRVDNRIAVGNGSQVGAVTQERYLGEAIDDATITAAIKSKMLWSNESDGLYATIKSQRGAVVLTGKAGSADAKALAGRLAANTRGVVSVDNQLMVDANAVRNNKAPEAVTPGAGQGIADAWITTKVKSTFLFSSHVSGSDISVDTREGVVTLAGKVDSGIERALAIELAQNIRGVKRVESVALVL
jgi:hyperosmotically inducible periplasmic protein